MKTITKIDRKKLLKEVREYFESMGEWNGDERKQFIFECLNGYCSECGNKLPEDGYCYCTCTD